MSTSTLPQHSIIVGQVFASDRPTVVSTVLGSCVAACLFDLESGIGGMNHFMLPDAKRDTQSAAFGVHAMELLINKIMQLGGDRRRLQAKVFGGGNVLALQGANLQVGQRNVEFVLTFLADEGIPVVGKRVGGNTGVKLCFQTDNGRALVKPLPNRAIDQTLQTEVQYLRRAKKEVAGPKNAVTLF
jgi:chemotaxis receptor (MCP) glutamine deamidase CheD